MKNVAILPAIVLTIVILLLTTCSKESPTESEIESDALASATIGPAGGQLSYEDFNLRVPAGAFTAEATLKLYFSETTHPMEQQAISPIYRLMGLPENFAQPLDVRIKYDDSLADCGYIVAGGEVENPITGQMQSAFCMFQASDSSSFLRAEILAPSGAITTANCIAVQAIAVNESLPVYLVATAGYQAPFDTAEFRFVLPEDVSLTERGFFAYDFCRAVDSLEAVGFSFAQVPKPIEVYLYPFTTPEPLEICVFLPSWGKFALSFDRRAQQNVYEYWAACYCATMRECVHLVACTYDNSYFNVLTNKRAIFNPERFWLHQATASCLEEKMFAPDPDGNEFLPMEFSDVDSARKEPLVGLQVPTGATLVESRFHGGGMSPLIKYMTNNHGDGIIWSLYERIDANDPPITALKNVFSESLNIWYPAFIKDYVRGNIYGGPSDGTSLYEDDVSGAFSIAGSSDTLHTFTNSYRDISGRIYIIDLDYSAIDSIQLSISSSTISSENLRLIVCGYKDGVTDPFLAMASQEVTIPDVLALKANGYSQLWAVVVNSAYTEPGYDGSGDVSLRVRAVLRETLPYNRCLPWFNLYCYFTEIVGGDPPDTSQLEGPFWPNWEPVPGTFDGLIFSADWNTVDSYDNAYSGNMQITLNPTYDTVLNFDVNTTIHRNAYQIENISFNGSNLPVTDIIAQTRKFKLTGIAACSGVSELADTLFTSEPSKIKTLDSIKCVTDSYVEFYFYTVDE